MAPGSISGAINTILAAINSTSTAITKFIRQFRAAHADLAAVTRELSELRLVLDLLLNDESEVPGPLLSKVLGLLDNCGNLLACIDSLLDKYSSSAPWAETGKSEIVPLRTNLETYRGSLALALEIVNLFAVKGSPHEAELVRDQILAELAVIRGQIPHVTEDDAVLHSYLDTITIYAKNPNARIMSSPKSPPGPQISRSPPVPAPQQSRSQPPSPPAALPPQAPLPQPPSQDSPHHTHQHRSSDPKPLVLRPRPPTRRLTEPTQPAPTPPLRSVLRPLRRDTGPVIPSSSNQAIETSQQPPPEVIPAPSQEQIRNAVPPNGSAKAPASAAPTSQQLPFEIVGPWYPQENLAVPFYHSAPLPIPTINQRGPGVDNRNRAYNSPKPPFAQQPAPIPQPRQGLQPNWNLPRQQYSDAPEVSLQQQIGQQHPGQQFAPGPLLFDNRAASATSSYGIPPQDRNNRLSDGSIPATPRSAYSANSSNDHSHGYGSPSPGAQQAYGSPPTPYPPATPYIGKSPGSSNPPTPNNLQRSSTTQEPGFQKQKRVSVDSFQLAPDPLGVHHARGSFPGSNTTPFNPPIYSPVPGQIYPSPSLPLAPELNSVFPPRPPATYFGAPQNGQMPVGPQGSSPHLSSPYSPSTVTVIKAPLLTISPARYFLEKDKGQKVFHLEVSPSSAVAASKHGNNVIKIWSLVLGSMQTSIKFTSYVNAQVRSREYFIRSHSILSESATLVAITAGFGHSIEVWNWTKKKRLQVIEDAHRWTNMRSDVYRSSWAPIAVYRGAPSEKIDLLRVSPDGSSGSLFKSKIFVETRPIELLKSGLPFLPRFPELAYSSTSPILVAAAGPRPGDPPRPHTVILAAWQLAVLHGEAHQLYRYIVPEYPEIHNALPVGLTVHGTICVSIWIPANHRDVASGSNYKHVTVNVTSRYVLVWDLSSNTTRIFPIPNVLACVSPDCRLVAYCDVASKSLAIVDVPSEEEVCRWPDLDSVAGYGQLDDLSTVTEFAFSGDGRMLIIGDEKGGVGQYDLRETRRVEHVPYTPASPAPPMPQWSELQ